MNGEIKQECFHECVSDCRREGCNCACGEFHCVPTEECRDPQEECPNHENLRDYADESECVSDGLGGCKQHKECNYGL